MHYFDPTTKFLIMKYLSLLLLFVTLSCSKQKSVLLPEIENAQITELTDVSPVYFFYNTKEKDSLELNRANLISTTHWLFNIDKRFSLEQVIPSIILLQDKKRNAEVHKNENARNFYTCNDTSINTLGFIEFTNVIYKTDFLFPNVALDYENPKEQKIIIDFKSPRDIKLVTALRDSILRKSSIKTLSEDLSNLPQDVEYELILNINDQLSFQDYINFKSVLSKIQSTKIGINENEFIY